MAGDWLTASGPMLTDLLTESASAENSAAIVPKNAKRALRHQRDENAGLERSSALNGLLDEFEAIHSNLTVNLIATPRAQFKWCRNSESLREVVARNAEKFDYMPVFDEQDRGRLAGVVHLSEYFHELPPDEPVARHYEVLGEQHLIGSDASIRAFIEDADQRPFRLVVSDAGIVGLVSFSDLQKLPVRATLFSLVTGLEMAMAEAIQRDDPHDERWMDLIPENRREDVRRKVADARENEGIVNPLLFTQFCEKREILVRSVFAEAPDKRKVEQKLKRAETLRNNLAHANNYAETQRKAKRVCDITRTIIDLCARLSGSPAVRLS